MKKIFLILLVIAMMPVVSSCSDDENHEDFTKNKLIGTWNLEEVYYYK